MNLWQLLKQFYIIEDEDDMILETLAPELAILS